MPTGKFSGAPAPPPLRHDRREESSCVEQLRFRPLGTRLFPRFATLRTDIALFDDVEQLRWDVLRLHSTCSWRHVQTTLLSNRNIRKSIFHCVIRLSLPLHSSEDLSLNGVRSWRSDNKAQLVKRPRTSPLNLCFAFTNFPIRGLCACLLRNAVPSAKRPQLFLRQPNGEQPMTLAQGNVMWI